MIAARERRKRRAAHGEQPGTVRLAIPAGYEARWLSNARDRDTVESWISNSPDVCLYHAPSYIEFARGQNGRADLLWLVRDGNPVVGVPLHPGGLGRFNTGYAGLLFPPGRRDRPLRAGVTAVRELLEANRGTSLFVLQAAQSRAYDRDSRGRTTTLARHLEEVQFSLLPLYSRLLDLPKAGTSESQLDLSAEALVATGFEPYEPELRNQIRKAVGNGMTVRCELPSNAAQISTAYHDFVPIHQASWRRTGLNPHEAKYWQALSQAVIGGGGRDLIVYVHDRNGTPAAAAVCHVRDAHALYWAGCSTQDGLRANANPLCLHAAIQACRALGVQRFELGRFFAREPSDKERAVTNYKAQFGGDLVRVVGFERGSGLTATVRRIARLRRQTMWFSYVGA